MNLPRLTIQTQSRHGAKENRTSLSRIPHAATVEWQPNLRMRMSRWRTGHSGGVCDETCRSGSGRNSKSYPNQAP